jgi:hypothetical protein
MEIEVQILEMLCDYSNIVSLALKLHFREPLDVIDELCLRELMDLTGWDVDDIVEELRNLWTEPHKNVRRYKKLFEKLYRDAMEFVGRDAVQSAEKIWGAIVALIKLHAALKNVFIGWTSYELYIYVTNYVEEENRRLFYDLLKAGEAIHKYFYKRMFNSNTFKEYWREAVELIEKAREVI